MPNDKVELVELGSKSGFVIEGKVMLVVLGGMDGVEPEKSEVIELIVPNDKVELVELEGVV